MKHVPFRRNTAERHVYSRAFPGNPPLIQFMEHASPAVNVENARVYLGGHEILHNISWQVQRGERCFILGANGAGKTTLVKVLMGFAWPLFGARVQVLGKTFGHVNLLELRKSIAWVSPFMHKWLEDGSWNGRDMVLSGPDGTIGLLREPTPEEEEKAAGIMKSLKAEHLMDRPVVAMSSGEQVKVLIARALMTNPELMILDEPTAGLDPDGVEKVLNIMNQLNEEGMTLIISSHDIDMISKYADKIFVLYNGEIIESVNTLEEAEKIKKDLKKHVVYISLQEIEEMPLNKLYSYDTFLKMGILKKIIKPKNFSLILLEEVSDNFWNWEL